MMNPHEPTECRLSPFAIQPAPDWEKPGVVSLPRIGRMHSEREVAMPEMPFEKGEAFSVSFDRWKLLKHRDGPKILERIAADAFLAAARHDFSLKTEVWDFGQLLRLYFSPNP